MFPVHYPNMNGGITMKKLLVLVMALVMTLSLAACGRGDTQEAADTNANPPAKEEWVYKDVTPEQIQAISDVLVELEPLYNKAAAAAVENGWSADETVVQELNVVYALIDAGKHGVADPSEYEGAKDMAAVVEHYQVILGAMPGLIAKVSEPYKK
jgi:ABC-type glycerol-3-phosphate transport system substrate-binding protein